MKIEEMIESLEKTIEDNEDPLIINSALIGIKALERLLKIKERINGQ